MPVPVFVKIMECLNIPKMQYRIFSRHLHNKKESERLPLEGAIEVTSHCNLTCRHCYIRDNSTKDELTLSEWECIIDEVAEAGCLWVTFSGGEPFLRPDFLDIYAYAKRKGLIIVLFTNATLITPQIADYLEELKPFYIEISLYGMSRQTYKNVTGSGEAYDRCMETISLLLQRKVLFKLKSVLIRDDRHEMAEMRKFAKSLGVDFRFDFLINPRIDGGKDPCETRVTPEEGVNMEMADEEVRQEMSNVFLELEKRENSDLLFPCIAGRNSFNIDSRGNLNICNMVRFINYDLRKGSFKEGWGLFPEILSRKLQEKSKCSTCPIEYICNRCPGWARMEYGDEEALIEYACEITHLRAKAILGEEVNKYEDRYKETLSETPDSGSKVSP